MAGLGVSACSFGTVSARRLGMDEMGRRWPYSNASPSFQTERRLSIRSISYEAFVDALRGLLDQDLQKEEYVLSALGLPSYAESRLRRETYVTSPC